MTRTQWRRYQRNKKVDKEASTSQWKTIETPEQNKYYPKGRLGEKEKIIANQRLAMKVAPLGKRR